MSVAASNLHGESRLRSVVQNTSTMRWAATVGALGIAGLASAGTDPSWVILWLFTSLALQEVIAADLAQMAHDPAEPIVRRLDLATRWIAALGFSHGSAALFMLDGDVAVDAILTMIVVSLSATAVSTFGNLTRAFVIYAALLLLPCAATWLLEGGRMGWGVGVLVLASLGTHWHLARRRTRAFIEFQDMVSDNVDLRRQLNDRTLIAIARDAAVQANQSKSGFLAAASHDLRQPLQSLSLNVGALSRTAMDENSRLICTEIGQSVDALRHMLDALLDISTLDAGGVLPSFCQVPLDRLLDAVCAGFRPAAVEKGLHLLCSCPPGTVVTSDVGMLRRVISNLIDNAIKFTDRGGVTLSVTTGGDRVRLVVVDTGRGIQAGNLTRVFEDLAQIGNPERNRAFGHGLGLGIVRRLCDLLGIEHSLDSKAGEGTRFCLDMPGRQVGEVLNADRPAPNPALISRRVLVLDDDAAVRNAYGHALRGLGCQVTCFATLSHALAHAAINQPELALVDYRLAENDNGIDAVRRLRAVHPGLVAVIVSADTTPELRATASRESIPLLRKPVTDAVLAAAIHGALREAHPRQTGTSTTN